MLPWVIALPGCRPSGPQGDPSPPPMAWEGELRILPGDTAFMPCGIHKAYRLTGPGLDSLARRYAWLRTVPGQWIKAWCNGYLQAGPAESTDSVLTATAYMHMDSEVNCPPVPVDGLAGSYLAEAEVPGGIHTERLEFQLGGDALIITTAPGIRAEVDGRWGLDSDGDLLFTEADGRYSFHYGHKAGRLVRPLPAGRAVAYRRTGPADRLAGAQGRAARWLAATARAQGRPVQAGDLRPAMRIDSLFPGTAAQEALRRSAADSLGLNEHQLRTTWPAAQTVHDVTKLMRTHLRAER